MNINERKHCIKSNEQKKNYYKKLNKGEKSRLQLGAATSRLLQS